MASIWTVTAQFNGGALTLSHEAVRAIDAQEAVERMKATSGFDADFWSRADWVHAHCNTTPPPPMEAADDDG